MSHSIQNAQPELDHISLYPLVLNDKKHHLATNSLETLVAISHSIEDAVMQHRLKGTVYAGFQRLSSFLPQINRFARLAAICGEVIVFAHPDTAVPEIPDIQFVLLSETAPLADEWFIVFDTTEFHIALLTRQVTEQLKEDVSSSLQRFGRGRNYQGTVTTQPSIVSVAHRVLDQILYRPISDVPSQPLSGPDKIQDPMLTFGQKLTIYLERQNRELGGLYRTLAMRTETLENLQRLLRALISRTAWQHAEAIEALNDREQQPAPRQQTLTVLFTDIEGFTALSETVPAAELLDSLNRYFDILATTVYGQQGDVDKFLGDGMLAFFEDPAAALQTALLIQKRINAFNDQQLVARQTPFITRISLVTGPCLLARIGSRDRQEITILGDTVNLASRLQALAPTGGIVLDEQTFAAAGQPPALHTTAKIRGKNELQLIYEIDAPQLNELDTFLKRNQPQPVSPELLTE